MTAEENFNGYFWTEEKAADGRRLTRAWAACNGKATSATACRAIGTIGGRFHVPFSIDREPNQPNRFGWIIETTQWIDGDTHPT